MSEIEVSAAVPAVTITTSTSPAYSTGDQIGGINTIANAVVRNFKTGTLIDVVIIDKDGQNAAIDVYLFSASPTLVSTDNAAFSISDSEAAAKLLGFVSVAATDYSSTAQNSIASPAAPKPIVIQPSAESTSIYAVLVSRGTPTYTSTSALTLKLGIAKD